MAMFCVIAWIIFNAFVIHEVYGTKCHFHGDTAVCDDIKLTYIPFIPSNIQTLKFVRNKLDSVTMKTFSNITNPDNLLTLILTNNSIVNISDNAFSIFRNLSMLELSKNRININDMRHLLEQLSLSNQLDKLFMDSMGSDTINEKSFSLLNKTPARKLSLESNEINRFTVDTLKRLSGVLELRMDKNKMLDIKLPVMNNLIELRIPINNLVEIPKFCSGKVGGESLAKNLEYLFLSHNLINTINNDTCRCLPKLTHLGLGRNAIAVYPAMFISQCSALTHLDVGSGTGHSVQIYPLAFSSSSLQFLQFGFNGDALDAFKSLPDTFQGLPSLTNIRLSYINMLQLSNKNVSDLFLPLSNLVSLQCYGCHLQGDMKYVLNNKPNLTTVNLNSNYFEHIYPGTFDASSNILNLRLGFNKIGHFKPNALPLNFLDKLEVLDLSKNPFICDCDLVWLIDWMKSTNKSKLSYFPSAYRCASPARWANKLITDVEFSYLECHPFSTIEWFGMIGGPLILIVIITAIVLYRNRWNIKHYIYMLRKRREYKPLEGNAYIYDAFVAYSHSESEWVVKVLIPMLENDCNLKLCVHQRDFQVGAFINDNIVERMNESKQVILVLSNSFAASEWCMFEMKVAHSMQIEDGVDVIVIMYEELMGRHMNNSLKVLLESTTYLEWTEDVVGNELFITKLKDSMGIPINA